MMDRRKLIMLLSASAAALMGQTVKPKPTTTTGTIEAKDLQFTGNTTPMTFALILDGFGGFVIKRHDKEIRITSDEIWEALGGTK